MSLGDGARCLFLYDTDGESATLISTVDEAHTVRIDEVCVVSGFTGKGVKASVRVIDGVLTLCCGPKCLPLGPWAPASATHVGYRTTATSADYVMMTRNTDELHWGGIVPTRVGDYYVVDVQSVGQIRRYGLVPGKTRVRCGDGQRYVVLSVECGVNADGVFIIMRRSVETEMEEQLVQFNDGYSTAAEIEHEYGWDRRKVFTYLDGVAARCPQHLQVLEDKSGWRPWNSDSDGPDIRSASPSEAFFGANGMEHCIRVVLVDNDLP